MVEGADAFLEFLIPTLGDAVTVHQGHMPEIEITSETTARGIWALEDSIWWTVNEMHGYGHYHETYEKVDGSWKIKSSRLTRLKVDFASRASGA